MGTDFKKIREFVEPFFMVPIFFIAMLVWRQHSFALDAYWVAVWIIGALYGMARAGAWFVWQNDYAEMPLWVNIGTFIIPIFMWPLHLYYAIVNGCLGSIIIRPPVGKCLYSIESEVSEWTKVNHPTFWLRPVIGPRYVYFFRQKDQIFFMLSGLGKFRD